MKAQVLYDWREETARISGMDLHELFRFALDGEPSPSGRADILPAMLSSAPAWMKMAYEEAAQWSIEKGVATMLVNLTPHVLNIYDEGKVLVHILPPEPTPARVAVSRKMVERRDSIPVYETAYGDLQNLPEPKAGVTYVVSMLVSNAVPERLDVLSPGELLRDEAGQPVGCIGLTK